MKKWNTVAIVGVGLIGGSIGLALRRRKLARHVVGIGRRTTSLRTASRIGATTSTTTNLGRGVADADLIVVCTPVEQIIDHVLEASAACPPAAVITDAGSTKENIVAALRGELPRGVTFLGSHPLAGSQQAGCRHAQHNLFENRLVVITPTSRTVAATRRTIAGFWRALGARTIQMTPKAHDRAVAATSHVPHLIAAVLAASTPAQDLSLAASGWLDTTRVAAGNVELWRQILLDNKPSVLKSLDKFEKLLIVARQALESRDAAKVERILKAGKKNRDALGN